MEKMNTYILHREDNDFNDLLADPVVKQYFKTVLSWTGHIMIHTDGEAIPSEISSYILLKYGDHVATDSVIRDFSPRPYIDYYPGSRPKKYKNVYK